MKNCTQRRVQLPCPPWVISAIWYRPGPYQHTNYASSSGIEQEPTIHQLVLLNDSTTTPHRNSNGYHHHHPQALTPNTGLLYDDDNSFHDEGWTQFSFSAIKTKPDGANNENNGLETRGQQIPSSSPPTGSTASKKCEWKGCTFPRPFRRNAELMRRIKTVHISRDAYKCLVCGKAFGRKDKMEDHRRVHTHTHTRTRTRKHDTLGRKGIVLDTRHTMGQLGVLYMRD
jgi:hypothetical protein